MDGKWRARLPPFSAESWGYSAFQYIMAPQALKKSAARPLRMV